ncbi:MAG: hypothetical protein QME79_10380 [Bacillota bacterium]|nr:hypothetical protein [Bacillota bacterium]
MSVRVFLGGSELLGLRHPSYADPLIAVCQAAGLDFTYRPDLECLFIASPVAGALVALKVEEPSSGTLRRRLTALLRGAGAQVVSEVGLIGRRYGDVALRLVVEEGRRVTEIRYPLGSALSRILACGVARALDQAGLPVEAPRGEFAGFGRRVPLARVRVAEAAPPVAADLYAQGLFLGITRFLWWRSLARCRERQAEAVQRGVNAPLS